MKLTARLAQALTLALVVFAVLPAHAAQSRGYYFGVGAGDAQADISVGDLNKLFSEASAAQGATFTPQTSSIDTKNSSLYVFGGYRIFRWLSAEVGYIDLGGFDYTSNATLFIPGSGSQQLLTHMVVKSQGASVSALGTWPVNDYFEFHGRVGFSVINTDANVNGGSVGQPISSSASGISFAPQIGVGAAVNIGKHFSLSGDWVHFFGIDSGGSSDQNKNFSYDGFDSDVLRLSAIVRF